MDNYDILKIECLRYKLIELTPDIIKAGHEAYRFEDEKVELILENKIATIFIKEETNSIEAAKQIAQKYISGIETLWYINQGDKHFELEYIHSDLLVQYPETGEIRRKRRLETTIILNVKDTKQKSATLLTNDDIHLLTSPNALILATRYKQYLEGKETVASMGYYCFTVIHHLIKNNENSNRYAIESEVLNTLSKLTSIYGDRNSARKYVSERPHTDAEIKWIVSAIRILMGRVALVETGASHTLVKIRMADLPKLEV